MECLIKSIDLGKTSSDLLTKARNYTVQGTLYYLYYNWDKIIECSLAACDCYKTIGDIDNYGHYILIPYGLSQYRQKEQVYPNIESSSL